jgi:hypothetical protein
VPGPGVISAVSNTLVSVLTSALDNGMPDPPIAELSNLQGNIPTSPARLTVFLFEVAEDPSARNKPRTRSPAGPNIELKKPPMALVLRYLVTAWGGNRETEHTLLGVALRALYDGALISGPDLKGADLEDTAEVLKVTLLPLTLEERTRVWYSVQRPYRLSLYYEVRVVNLESNTSRSVRSVANRDLDYARGAVS